MEHNKLKINPLEPTNNLFSNNKANEDTLNFQNKFSHYRGFEKDGNSFFNSFSYAYVERLLTRIPTCIHEFIEMLGQEEEGYDFCGKQNKKVNSIEVFNHLYELLLDIANSLEKDGSEKALKSFLHSCVLDENPNLLQHLVHTMKNGISNFLTSHPDLEIGEIRISEQLGGQTIEEYSELFLNFVGEPNMLIWQIFPLLIRTNIRIHVFKDFSGRGEYRIINCSSSQGGFEYRRGNNLDMHEETIHLICDELNGHFSIAYSETALTQFPQLLTYDKHLFLKYKKEEYEYTKTHCPICKLALPNKSTLTLELNCRKHTYHTKCLSIYFSGILGDKEFQLVCPGEKCQYELSPSEMMIIRKLIDEIMDEGNIGQERIICCKCTEFLTANKPFVKLDCAHYLCSYCIINNSLISPQIKGCPSRMCKYKLSRVDIEHIAEMKEENTGVEYTCNICNKEINMRKGYGIELSVCGDKFHKTCLIYLPKRLTISCPNCRISMSERDRLNISDLVGYTLETDPNVYIPTEADYFTHFHPPKEEAKLTIELGADYTDISNSIPISSSQYLKDHGENKGTVEPSPIIHRVKTTSPNHTNWICPRYSRCAEIFQLLKLPLSYLNSHNNICFCKDCYVGPTFYCNKVGNIEQLPLQACKFGISVDIDHSVNEKEREEMYNKWSTGYISGSLKTLGRVMKGGMGASPTPEFNELNYISMGDIQYLSPTTRYSTDLRPPTLHQNKKAYKFGVQFKIKPEAYQRVPLIKNYFSDHKGKIKPEIWKASPHHLVIVGILIWENYDELSNDSIWNRKYNAQS